MKKSELVTFLKEEYARIEEVLLALGEIKKAKQDDETTNDMIQQAFRFLELQLEKGNYENALSELKERKWSSRKWI